MASIIKADTLQSTTSNIFVLNSAGTEYARFDSTGLQLSGNTLSVGGTSLPGNSIVTLTGTQTLTNKTLSTGLVMGVSAITSGTAQASTSNTSIDFTSIPSWVKRITVMFNGISTNGASNYQIQIGAGSVTTTGYLSVSSVIALSTVGSVAFTAGFGIQNGATATTTVSQGAVTLYLLSGNVWVANGLLSNSDGVRTVNSAGSITLGGTLDRVRITTVNGTDTFDAGSINILYE